VTGLTLFLSVAALFSECPCTGWELTLESDDASPAKRPSFVARSMCTEAVRTETNGVRRLVWRTVGDGTNTWSVEVTLLCRATENGVEVSGRLANGTPDMRIALFEGPHFDGMTVAGRPALCLANGLGARVEKMPTSAADADPKVWINRGCGLLECDAGWRGNAYWYPGPNRTMPYLALEGRGETLYFGCHDRRFDAKDLRALYDTASHVFRLSALHPCTIGAGAVGDLPPVALERLKGDWHAAARRYRKWYDTVMTPIQHGGEDRDFTGWALVILKQQNREIIWPYGDFDRLADVAVAHGLEWVGLFGWTGAGHDNCYPDYAPCPEMGGRDGLVAGIRALRARGLKVFTYANGQLFERGTTEYWRTTGRHHAVRRSDGTPDQEIWQKYSSAQPHVFDIACLHSEAWFERMLDQARQAADLGADGILYDQFASVQSRRCYGVGHGHPVGQAIQGGERVAFIRRLRDEMRKVRPGFRLLTEGFADCEMDAISIFHGCENGVFGVAPGLWLDRMNGRCGTAFPEFVRYTFPELTTSTRVQTPVVSRTMVNYAALFGLRHEIEIRYAPDRRYVMTGRVPEVDEYGDIISKPDLSIMRSGISQRAAAAYLRSVCDFQRRQARFLLRGTFVDTEGFVVSGTVRAKGYRADAGTLGVLVWNPEETAPATFAVSGAGRIVGADEPDADGAVEAASPLAANSLRLLICERRGVK